MDILVAINGAPESWLALDQAIQLAEMEKSDVRGLVVVPNRQDDTGELEDLERHFSERLQQAGISGNMVHAEGDGR